MLLPTAEASDRTQQYAEEKELLEHVASVFSVLDSRAFREVFNQKMGTLFDQVCSPGVAPNYSIPDFGNMFRSLPA